MLINILKNIESKVGKEKLTEAMDITTREIKLTRIKFDKRTKPLKFLKILLINLDVVGVNND